MHRDELAAHYRATTYRVDTPEGPVALRIGAPSPALDLLLARLGVSAWAFITACNPGSIPRSPEENLRSNADLLERLRRLGYDPLPGAGIGDDGGRPPEPSFFVPGIEADEALRLGRLHRQNAIVVGRAGEAPELLWCGAMRNSKGDMQKGGEGNADL